jgi:hypothetical protein
VSLDDIAAAWLAYNRRVPKLDDPWEHDPDWWAAELWMDTAGRGAWWRDEERVRAGILAIIDASDERDAGIIGAGLMEVFATDDESRVAWIEEHARTSERFRSSLANVWISGEVRDDVFARIEAAAGVPLPRPNA